MLHVCSDVFVLLFIIVCPGMSAICSNGHMTIVLHVNRDKCYLLAYWVLGLFAPVIFVAFSLALDAPKVCYCNSRLLSILLMDWTGCAHTHPVNYT